MNVKTRVISGLMAVRFLGFNTSGNLAKNHNNINWQTDDQQSIGDLNDVSPPAWIQDAFGKEQNEEGALFVQDNVLRLTTSNGVMRVVEGNYLIGNSEGRITTYPQDEFRERFEPDNGDLVNEGTEGQLAGALG